MRHDVHEALGWLHHGTGRLHRQADDMPVNRRQDFGALHVLTGGHQALGVGFHVTQHLAQLGLHLAAEFAEALQPALGNFGLRPQRALALAQQFGDQGVGFGALALQLQQAVARHITVLHQRGCIVEFFAQPLQLLAAADQHVAGAGQRRLLGEPAFVEGGQFGVEGLAARGHEQFLRLTVVGGNIALQVLVPADARQAVTLGQQAALRGTKRVVALAHSFVHGGRGSGVQAQQRLTRTHRHAFARQHLKHHAASGVLHGLGAGVDHHLRRRGYPFVKRRQRHPQHHHQQQGANDPARPAHTRRQRLLRRGGGWPGLWPVGHDESGGGVGGF